MKYIIDYEIVIPAYNCAEELSKLIVDIHATCNDYLPKRIIIIDDCSTDDATSYVGAIMDTRKFPIKTVSTNKQSGPFYAEQLGLNMVESTYAVVLHSDTRLQFQNVDVSSLKLHEDVISILICYLHQTADAAAVGCFSLDTGNQRKIATGPRVLGVNNIPFSCYMTYNFATLKRMDRYFRWQKVYSLDDNIYALRMQCYKDYQFDEVFAPYYLYHDDFFARCRENNFQSYLTQDVVAYHPRNKAKDINSLATLSQDVYEQHNEVFLNRYKDSPLWMERSLNIDSKVTNVL